MYRKIKLTTLLLLTAGNDDKSFDQAFYEKSSDAIFSQLKRCPETQYSETWIIHASGKSMPRSESWMGFRFTCDNKPCSLIIRPAEEPKNGRITKDGKDVELLLQGRPFKPTQDFDIEAVPHESSQVLSKDQIDAKNFRRNVHNFIDDLLLIQEENQIRGKKTYVISVFKTDTPDTEPCPGLSITCDDEACSIIIRPAELENNGRITKDGKDVELLLQGRPFKPTQDFDIEAVPLESTKEKTFQLELVHELSRTFAPYYRNLVKDMPNLDEETLNGIMSKYGTRDEPNYEALKNPLTGGTIFTSQESYFRFNPGITKTPDGRVVHLHQMALNDAATHRIFDPEGKLVEYLLVTWNGLEERLEAKMLSDGLMCIPEEDIGAFLVSPARK